MLFINNHTPITKNFNAIEKFLEKYYLQKQTPEITENLNGCLIIKCVKFLV
jgi:hypothetical protein